MRQEEPPPSWSPHSSVGDETISTFLVGFLTLSLYEVGTTRGPRGDVTSHPSILGSREATDWPELQFPYEVVK